MRESTRALILCLGLLSAGVASAAAAAARPPGRADPGPAPMSNDVRQVAGWVNASGDSHGLPFVLVDKVGARVFVFYPDGRLRGTSPVLLGAARGDDSVPGIGDRKLSTIRPEERTTPAGRFVASIGNDLGEKDIVWVDYAAAISLHRVITSNSKERRLQRLATPSTLDNRISYGCINVPARFYDTVVRPAFTGTNGIVYILPEIRPIRSVFPGYRADAHGRTEVTSAAPAQ
ncbi:L,D-transpeptidase [Phenylobacterium hankyongense]|uniref:L,D-transpeptidase n=1 Tax=Phenylobacterium hankyongense TaxID=1813876 RepID=UPI001A9DBA9F|nr:L,D-transpeptidase [Phenylobacterium hankyongense]